MSQVLRWTPKVSSVALPTRRNRSSKHFPNSETVNLTWRVNLGSFAGGESITEDNEELLPDTSQPFNLARDVLPCRPPSCPPRLLPFDWMPFWDRSHPPTVTSYLDGLHFSYDHTSASNYSTPVTPESYQRLLTEVDLTSEINIGRNISFLQCV